MDVLVEAGFGEVAAEHGGEEGVGFVGGDRCAGAGQGQGVTAEPGAEFEDSAERSEARGAVGGGGGRGGLLEGGGGVPAGGIGSEFAPDGGAAGDQVDGQRDSGRTAILSESFDGTEQVGAAQVGGGEAGKQFLAGIGPKEVQSDEVFGAFDGFVDGVCGWFGHDGLSRKGCRGGQGRDVATYNGL